MECFGIKSTTMLLICIIILFALFTKSVVGNPVTDYDYTVLINKVTAEDSSHLSSKDVSKLSKDQDPTKGAYDSQDFATVPYTDALSNVMDQSMSSSTTTNSPYYYSRASELIPDQYKLIVIFDVKHTALKKHTLRKLREAISKQLGLSERNVGISSIQKKIGLVELYVVYPVMSSLRRHSEDVSVLLLADDVLKQISFSKLQHDLGDMQISNLRAKAHEPRLLLHTTTKEVTIWKIFKNRLWSSWHFPLLITSSLFVIFALIVILMFVCYRWEAQKKELAALEEARQMVYHPILKPSIKDADSVQPSSRDSFYTETESEVTVSPCRSPLHIKAKGLLERTVTKNDNTAGNNVCFPKEHTLKEIICNCRRGSNASLTLDLNRSPDHISSKISPRSCSTKELLVSAGNRMNRTQLRNCLKNVKALHTEFWEIPMNHPEKTETPGSGTKNRYKTILPNEHSRVKLEETENDPLSTYINANYIRGYDSEMKSYIATQGPMAHTIVDFWQMVWQEHSPAIVMITKLKEKNKTKCEPYIPDCHAAYGEIDVTVVKVAPREGYTIRELLIKKGEKVQKVLHFWYTMWPDHKTPSTAKQLLAMALEVEAMRHDSYGTVKGPVVVHCSAGIGRTGCFIATAIGIQQLIEENMVDVLGIVCSLRMDRGGMVQTAEQYEFVHQALSLFEQTLPNHPCD